jgi:hypothetical protein
MLTPLEWLVVALGGWRLAALFVLDDGPFAIFRRIRERTWRDGSPVPFVGELLACVGCVSFYTVIVMWGLFRLDLDTPAFMIGAWGLIVLAHRATG